jgi:hypothetical protein
MKILHLTVTKKWFDLMITGEKDKEFRKPSPWILSRLWDKQPESTIAKKVYKEKQYDAVKFTNGYGSNMPYFIAHYKGFTESKTAYPAIYSDGSLVKVEKGDIIIKLGDIIEKGNIDNICQCSVSIETNEGTCEYCGGIID